MLGLVKIFHQPVCSEMDAGRIDVMKSPIVGTSHKSPTTMSTRLTGAFRRTRTTRDATLSRWTGSSAATAVILPPS